MLMQTSHRFDTLAVVDTWSSYLQCLVDKIYYETFEYLCLVNFNAEKNQILINSIVTLWL